MNSVAILQGVGEPFEHHNSYAISENAPLRVFVKCAAVAVWRLLPSFLVHIANAVGHADGNAALVADVVDLVPRTTVPAPPARDDRQVYRHAPVPPAWARIRSFSGGTRTGAAGPPPHSATHSRRPASR